jgi:hypothetical protein
MGCQYLTSWYVGIAAYDNARYVHVQMKGTINKSNDDTTSRSPAVRASPPRLAHTTKRLHLESTVGFESIHCFSGVFYLIVAIIHWWLKMGAVTNPSLAQDIAWTCGSVQNSYEEKNREILHIYNIYWPEMVLWATQWMGGWSMPFPWDGWDWGHVRFWVHLKLEQTG